MVGIGEFGQDDDVEVYYTNREWKNNYYGSFLC